MAVDTALRLLELVALLFPVVALLLQLQYRAAETTEMERVGLLAGGALLGLLGFSFLLAAVDLLRSGVGSVVLVVVTGLVAVAGFSVPGIVVLSRAGFVEGLRSTTEGFVSRLGAVGATSEDGDDEGTVNGGDGE
jgi:hypothetical protein